MRIVRPCTWLALPLLAIFVACATPDQPLGSSANSSAATEQTPVPSSQGISTSTPEPFPRPTVGNGYPLDRAGTLP